MPHRLQEFDAIHKDGGARQPSEKRLIIDLVATKGMLTPVTPDGGFCQAMTTPLRWIPTEVQLADAFAKIMNATKICEFMTEGHLTLPLVDTRADFLKLQNAGEVYHTQHAQDWSDPKYDLTPSIGMEWNWPVKNSGGRWTAAVTVMPNADQVTNKQSTPTHSQEKVVTSVNSVCGLMTTTCIDCVGSGAGLENVVATRIIGVVNGGISWYKHTGCMQNGA